MDKYEFNLKVSQMKKLASDGDYATAMKIADGIDWRRVPNLSLLTLVSEIYEKNGEYGEAREILLLAYDKAPMGRGILYRLTELSLTTGKVQEAEQCFREFQDLAPKDPRLLILRYQILKAKGASSAQLIEPLEQYNAAELDEKWMYELAEAYHKAGRHEDCVNLCDRITLLFGTGAYVDKAMMLKTEGENAPLSDYQRSLIDDRAQHLERLREVQEEYRRQDAAPETAVPADTGEGAAFAQSSVAAAVQKAPEAEETAPAAGAAGRSGAAENAENPGGVQIPEFVLKEPMEAIDDGAAPEIQSEIDAEIQAHLEKIEREREQILSEKRRNAAAQAAVRAMEHSEEAGAVSAEEEEAELSEEEAELPEDEAAFTAAPMEETPAVPAEAEAAASDRTGEETAAAPEQAGEETAAASEQAGEKTAAAPEQAGEEIPAASAESEAAAGSKEEDSAAEVPADDITRVLPRIKTGEKTERKKPAENAAEASAGSPAEKLEDNAAPAEDSLGKTRILPNLQSVRKEPEREAPQPEMQEPEEPERISERPGDSNGFIEGKTAEEGLAAAISRLRAVHAATGIGNSAAKIRAERLNVRGVAASAEKISGKDLIIEEAGDLSDQSIRELLDLIRQDAGVRTILLVDNPLQLSRLANRNAEFTAAFHAEKFTGGAGASAAGGVKAPAPVSAAAPARSSGAAPVRSSAAAAPRKDAGEARAAETGSAPLQKDAGTPGKPAPEQTYAEEELDIDTFAHYASDYARKIDCVITGKSMLALYERIEIMQDDGVKLTRKNAEALIEEVADRAEKPPLLKKLGGIFSPKYDKDGMLILKEEDF